MMPSTAETVKDRVKLPFQFDVDKMLEEVRILDQHQFNYYKALPLRAPAHTIDSSLPFPPPADDYADGSWTPWLDSPLMQKAPYLTEVIDTFKAHTKVTLVRLLRLAPNAIVKKHTDPTLGLEVHKSVVRLTVPILNNDKVVFYLNDEPVLMKPGECWYLRLTDPHEVVNGGNEERINMSIDMIPNDWLRDLISSYQ
ncbi:MAG: aspartyl/asparaginyl beta-hydroxylase domain-containing protein [Bacteroidota bacterium]